MNIVLNKDKSIGKVLYIVEGGKTEPYILRKVFTKVFNYQLETIIWDKGYKKYNSKDILTSQVFVINAEESNIKNIDKDNEFLDRLFGELIENYDFDIDNCAMYYLFDRDSKSNTDTVLVKRLISSLVNSRENADYLRIARKILKVRDTSWDEGISADEVQRRNTELFIKKRLEKLTLKHQTAPA